MSAELTHEQYAKLMPRVTAYAAVDPAPDSRYGRWLLDVLPLIEAYERKHFQAHAPQEFDCSECGQHVIDASGIVLTRCAACIHVPGWYDHPEVARILDPEHSRTRT